MKLNRLFTQHPAAVGESYSEHCRVALSFSLALLTAAAACAVHALLPFLFQRRASTIIAQLHHRMVVARVARRPGGGLDAPTYPGYPPDASTDPRRST